MNPKCREFTVRFLLCGFLILSSFFDLAFSGSGSVPSQSNRDSGKNDIIIIHNPEVSKSDKEALIIIPGIDIKGKGRKELIAYFGNVGYDLYIPDYKDRSSMNLSLEQFEMFYFSNGLDTYKKVHVLSYILGTWILNKFIIKNGKLNIVSIVYDRSPLQERAPRIAIDKVRLPARILFGKVLFDLESTEYPSIEKENISIGILIESKATPFVKLYKKRAMKYGPIDWNSPNLNQEYDDLIYTPFNHDEMYLNFNVIGPDILHFYQDGKFREESRRLPYEWDVFKKHCEQ